MQASLKARAAMVFAAALGELEAGVLELEERAAEGLALLGVGDGALDARPPSRRPRRSR